jgi:metalloendopeptidase OMA1, mitochondrial
METQIQGAQKMGCSPGFLHRRIEFACFGVICEPEKGNAGMKNILKPLGSLIVGCAIAVLLAAVGCSTAPVTGRHQLNTVSSGDEVKLGLSSFEQLKTNTPISHDGAMNAMVQRVGKRVAVAASNDLPAAQWEFVVFESPEANAFCLPGGKVGVYTGLLQIIKDDAELATVIGHEVGHATAHHGAERMSEATAMQELGQLLGSAVTTSNQIVQSAFPIAYGGITKYGRSLPHSRAQESEADHIGVIYMARAGYDPQKSLDFWQRFAEYIKQHGGGSESRLSKYLSDHPVTSDRIADLKKWLPQAQAEYQKSRMR